MVLNLVTLLGFVLVPWASETLGTGVQTAMFALSVPLAFAGWVAVVVLWVLVYAGLAVSWAVRASARS